MEPGSYHVTIQPAAETDNQAGIKVDSSATSKSEPKESEVQFEFADYPANAEICPRLFNAFVIAELVSIAFVAIGLYVLNQLFAGTQNAPNLTVLALIGLAILGGIILSLGAIAQYMSIVRDYKKREHEWYKSQLDECLSEKIRAADSSSKTNTD